MSVCGPASINRGVFDARQEWDEESTAYRQLWDQLLRPQIREALTLESQGRILLRTKQAELVANGQVRIDRNHPMRVIWHYLDLMKVLPNAVHATAAPQRQGAELVLILDEEGFRTALADFSENHYQAALLIARKIYLPLLKDQLTQRTMPYTNSLTLRLAHRYPGMDPQQVLPDDAESVLRSVRLIESRLGRMMVYQTITPEELSMFERAKNGAELNSFESSLYAELASTIESYAALLSPEIQQALIRLPFDEVELTDLVRRFRIPAEDAPSTASITKTTNAIEKSCRRPLQMSLSTSLSDLRRRRVSELIKDIVAAGQVVAGRLAPSGYEEALRQWIDKTEFALPDSLPLETQQVRHNLNQRIQRSNEIIRELENPDRNLRQILLYLMALEAQQGERTSDENPTDALAALCQRFEPKTINDAALTSKGRIMVSWYSAAYPSDGIGIIAHELGHVVSYALRRMNVPSPRATFVDSLNCIANRNPLYSQAVPLLSHENSRWSEEDWADFFSTQVLLELKKTQSPWARIGRNFGCALIVDTGKEYGRNTIDPHPADPHSSGLLRLLMVQLDLDAITPACRPLQAAVAARSPGTTMRCEAPPRVHQGPR